jgi:UDP-N-acetyl-D-glucosamine dehydrogenase
VNIALVNELKVLFDRMGIDVWEVIAAAKTKPFGFQAFYPGPGLGGHCIPIDPYYLSWVARKHGFTTRFIELAGEINTSMPSYVVGKVADALNDRGIALKGSKILLLGMAYKKDVDDPRESPGFELMERLLEKGAEVEYNDPHIPTLPSMRRYPHLKQDSRPLSADYLGSRDCVLIATDHSSYDWPWIVASSRLVVDTRNATRGLVVPAGRIVRA